MWWSRLLLFPLGKTAWNQVSIVSGSRGQGSIGRGWTFRSLAWKFAANPRFFLQYMYAWVYFCMCDCVAVPVFFLDFIPNVRWISAPIHFFSFLAVVCYSSCLKLANRILYGAQHLCVQIFKSYFGFLEFVVEVFSRFFIFKFLFYF